MRCPKCDHEWDLSAKEMVEELSGVPSSISIQKIETRTIDTDDLLYLTGKET